MNPWKGDSYWKPSFLGAMLVLGRVLPTYFLVRNLNLNLHLPPLGGGLEPRWVSFSDWLSKGKCGTLGRVRHNTMTPRTYCRYYGAISRKQLLGYPKSIHIFLPLRLVKFYFKPLMDAHFTQTLLSWGKKFHVKRLHLTSLSSHIRITQWQTCIRGFRKRYQNDNPSVKLTGFPSPKKHRPNLQESKKIIFQVPIPIFQT